MRVAAPDAQRRKLADRHSEYLAAVDDVFRWALGEPVSKISVDLVVRFQKVARRGAGSRAARSPGARPIVVEVIVGSYENEASDLVNILAVPRVRRRR